MELIFYIFAFLFGAAIGSFLNVVIYRLPREESIVFPPSHCPKCDYQIKWYDNIPILSYLFLRGKCRNCGTHISLQYPAVEFLTAVTFVLLLVKFGLSPAFFTYILFSCLLLSASLIDLTTFFDPPAIPISDITLSLPKMYLISKPEEKEEGDPENLVLEGILQDEIYTFENEQEVEIPISQKIEKEKLPSIIVKPIEIAKGIIPDELTFGGIVFALFFAFLSDITRLNFMLWQNNSWRSSTNGLIAAIGWIWGISFVFKMVAKKEGMGMGDVKLFGFIGAILGVKLGLLSIFFSAFIGLIVTIINKVGRRQPFPFGPFLAIGTYLSLFLGERILSLLY